MTKQKAAKKEAEKDRKWVPILIRVCAAEYELVKERPSILGMNVSTFLRLLIRAGRIELDKGAQNLKKGGWTTQEKGRLNEGKG